MSDFLFAQPSVVFGVARLLDLFGQFDRYNQSRTEKEADAKGLYCDWHATGQEVYAAIPKNEEDVRLMDAGEQLLLPLR